MARQTNWFVVTGAPASGKTSTLVRLQEMYQCRVLSEVARDLIDNELAKGRTLAEIRRDEVEFQNQVFSEKLAREASLAEDEVVLFDRGLHDTIAFLALRNVRPDAEIIKVCEEASYARIFLLERLASYHVDYARSETSQEAGRLQDLLMAVYAEHTLTIIPPVGLDERVEIIHKLLPLHPGASDMRKAYRK